MDGRIIEAISSPLDLKLLSDEELAIVAQEVREQIIMTTSRTGGHVASSLGAVELILAIHSVIDSPRDKLVFDVGHQAYAHKILSGRLPCFESLRSYGGLSGFPKPSESPHDVHPSGHASDSLSVALGLAKARDLRGSDEAIVTLIGDAGISGGMAFEALNQIGQDQTKMVIVLNDNEMSISHNVGALVNHFGSLRASNRYRKTRDSIQKCMETGGPLASGVLNWGRSIKDSFKHLIIPDVMLFEQLGITCTAPIDGHDIAALRAALVAVLATDGPTLMHVVTKKGMGYQPAMDDPERFHGTPPYEPETGKSRCKPAKVPKFMQVFGDALCREAAVNEDVVAITAAMKDGTGLTRFAEEYPERFVDVGIAEEHAVGLASGFALGGKKPVVAIYSTFLQRAIDQMIIDVALPKLDVVFCVDRAGLVGDDGPTHNGMFDLVYARMIPGMRVFAPANEADLVCGLHTALASEGPFLIRYPRGEARGVAIPEEPELLEPGEALKLREGNSGAMLAFGSMVYPALGCAELLSHEGIELAVWNMRWVKPLDEAAILEAGELPFIVTIEEGVVQGGVGEEVLSVLASHGLHPPTRILGLPDRFISQGKVAYLHTLLGLDAEGIAQAIRELVNETH